MPRHSFGMTLADFSVTTGTGNALILTPSVTWLFYTAATGGTQYTDLAMTSGGGTPVTSMASNSAGELPQFFGPNNVVEMWASADGGPRAKILANDIGTSWATTDTALTNHMAAISPHSGAVTVIAGVTGAQAINWSTSRWYDLTLSGDVTLTFTGLPASGTPATLMLAIHQPSGGGKIVTWPSVMAWDEGTAPLQSAIGSATDLYSMVTLNGGTDVFGEQVGKSKAAPPGSGGSTPAVPAALLDLSKWYLGTPIARASDGKSTSIKRPLLDTYSHPDYFHVNAAGDGVVFSAPCGGATTSNSGNPRSELREMSGSDGLTEISWGMSDGLTHTLTCTFAINEMPIAKPEVVVGQIHDHDDDIIEIEATGFAPTTGTTIVNGTGTGAFLVIYKFNGTANWTPADHIINGLTIGAKATYKIVVNTANGIRIYGDLGTTATTLRRTIASGWPSIDNSANLYFKAGCYGQSNLNNLNDNGTPKHVQSGTCAGGASLTVPAAGDVIPGDAPSARSTVTIYSLTHTHV